MVTVDLAALLQRLHPVSQRRGKLPPLSLAVLQRLASTQLFQSSRVSWNGTTFDAIVE